MEKSLSFHYQQYEGAKVLMPPQLDSVLNLRRCFFFWERGKKNSWYIYFTGRLLVNICVIVMCHIVTEIQAIYIEMIFIYPRYRQAVNVKLI